MRNLVLAAGLLFCTATAHAARAVMENISATSATIRVDTNNLRVGIATGAPQATLHVEGSVLFKGPLPTITVEAYGARADGVLGNNSAGTNNYSAIYNAIASAPINGAVIALSSHGVYRVASTISIPCSKKLIFQCGGSPNADGNYGTAIYCSMTNGTDCFQSICSGQKPIEFRDCGIYGNTSARYGVLISSAQDSGFTFERSFVGFFGQDCLRISGSGASGSSSNNRIINSRFRNCGGHNIHLIDAASETDIDNVVSMGGSLSNLAHSGSTLMGSLKISGGDFTQIAGNDAPAISLSNVSAVSIDGIYIEHPRTARTAHLIDIGATSGNFSHAITIKNSTLAGGDQSSGTGSIISVANSSMVAVEVNSISCGSNRAPIKTDSNSMNIRWQHNRVSGCDAVSIQGVTGAYVTDDGGRVAIGTSPPTGVLTVYKTSDGDIQVKNSAGTVAQILAASPSNVGLFGTSSQHSTILQAGSNSVLYVTTNSKVGVMISSPTAQLHINGPVATTVATLASLSSNTIVYVNGATTTASIPMLGPGGIVIGTNGVAPATGTITGSSNQVIVTNASGKITLSTPQSIDTAANATFGSLVSSGSIQVGGGTPMSVLSTGTYTPTVTGVTNIASVGTVGTGTFFRSGNYVSVRVRFTVTPSAAADTSTEVGISLPVASNLSAADDLIGLCNTSGRAQRGGDVQEDNTNDRGAFQYQSQTTSATTFRCMFDYVIK